MQARGVSAALIAAYTGFVRIASGARHMLLLAIRLYWGWQFAITGWGKLHHLPKVTGFLADLGIPAPAFAAVSISWLEFLGGILLAIGLGSRFTSLLLCADMFVAYLTAGRQNLLAIFSDPAKFYGDDAFTFLLASLLIVVFGPGRLAIDAVLKHSMLQEAVGCGMTPAERVRTSVGSDAI